MTTDRVQRALLTIIAMATSIIAFVLIQQQHLIRRASAQPSPGSAMPVYIVNSPLPVGVVNPVAVVAYPYRDGEKIVPFPIYTLPTATLDTVSQKKLP